MLAYLQKNTNSTLQIWYFQKKVLPLQPQRMPTGTLNYKLTYRRKALRRKISVISPNLIL